MAMILAFDVDETLDCAGGPIPVAALRDLHHRGYIVGLNGNWARLVQSVPDWHTFISFLGPLALTKADFLRQLATYIPHRGGCMIGNDPTIFGSSDDAGAARDAGWPFMTERDFLERYLGRLSDPLAEVVR